MSNRSYPPDTPAPIPFTMIGTPMLQRQRRQLPPFPARSTSSYSMIEAEITEPAYTPPSSEDRDDEEVKKACIDDSFDSMSFAKSAYGSDAGSHKTHSSYARSHNDSFWALFGGENGQHGVVPSTGNTPPPSVDGSDFVSIPKESRPANCDHAMPCWTEEEHLARIAEEMDAWNAGAIPMTDRKKGWATSISTMSSPISKKSQRGFYDDAGWRSSSPARWNAAGSSPTHKQYSETAREEIDADRDAMRMRLADLEDRLNHQAEYMDYYPRKAQGTKAEEKLYDDNKDRISGITPRDLDLIRSCVAGLDMSPPDRSRAMRVLSALQLEEQLGVASKFSDQQPIQAPDVTDTGAGRIEAQLGIMSRDIIKLKAYEKFRRMQEDSDRLARIESKLSGTHMSDSGTVPTIVDNKVKGLDELTSRVAKLEDIGNSDDRDSNPALLMLRLTKRFDELERHISSIEDDDNARYSEIRDDLSRLGKRFLAFRHRIQNDGRSEQSQSSSNLGAWNCKPAAGWNSNSIGTATSSGYLRGDKSAAKTHDFADIFMGAGGVAWRLPSSKKRNLSNIGPAESGVHFGSSLDYAHTRRSNDWPSAHGSERRSVGNIWPAKTGKTSNPGSVKRGKFGFLASDHSIKDRSNGLFGGYGSLDDSWVDDWVWKGSGPNRKRDGWGSPITNHGIDLHDLRKFSFPKSSSGASKFGGW